MNLMITGCTNFHLIENNLLTCLEEMEPLMGYTYFGLSKQMTTILAGRNHLTHHLLELEPQIYLISLGHEDC